MTDRKSEPKSPHLASRRGAIAGCLVFIALSGIANGYFGGRWTQQATKDDISDRLAKLPSRVGDWRMVTSTELDDQTQGILECYGSMVREYTNELTGTTVNVFIVSGPRGPIAVHTPEVCYSSTNSLPAGPRQAIPFEHGGKTDKLWKVSFRQQGKGNTGDFEVWYGWSDGGQWQAAEFPRIWLTDSLFKIQAAGPIAAAGEKSSPTQDFLQEFLPAVNRGTFETAENKSTGGSVKGS